MTDPNIRDPFIFPEEEELLGVLEAAGVASDTNDKAVAVLRRVLERERAEPQGGIPDIEERSVAAHWSKLVDAVKEAPNGSDILGIVHVLRYNERVIGRCHPWPVVLASVGARAVAPFAPIWERGYLVTDEDGNLALVVRVADRDPDFRRDCQSKETAPFLTDDERKELNGRGMRGIVEGQRAILRTLEWLADQTRRTPAHRADGSDG